MFKYIVLYSFLSVAGQFLPLAWHKHNEDFISPEPLLPISMFVKTILVMSKQTKQLMKTGYWSHQGPKDALDST